MHQGRGGYCMETNMLLGMALKALGYAVVPMLVRQWRVPRPCLSLQEKERAVSVANAPALLRGWRGCSSPARLASPNCAHPGPQCFVGRSTITPVGPQTGDCNGGRTEGAARRRDGRRRPNGHRPPPQPPGQIGPDRLSLCGQRPGPENGSTIDSLFWAFAEPRQLTSAPCARRQSKGARRLPSLPFSSALAVPHLHTKAHPPCSHMPSHPRLPVHTCPPACSHLSFLPPPTGLGLRHLSRCIVARGRARLPARIPLTPLPWRTKADTPLFTILLRMQPPLASLTLCPPPVLWPRPASGGPSLTTRFSPTPTCCCACPGALSSRRRRGRGRRGAHAR